MSDRTLPAGAEWATAPLLNGENVGRFVWLAWNGNRPEVAEIHKVGRSNITVGYGNVSLKVGMDGDVARSSGQRASSAMTEQHRLDREEHLALRKSLTEWVERASLAELRNVAVAAGMVTL